MKKTSLGILLASSALLLVGCDSVTPSDTSYGNPNTDIGAGNPYAATGGLFGPNGLNLFDFGGKKNQGGAGGAGIGVNTFLWKASLDTVSFMPLASADPFGGVIITDWYSPPETPGERFKINLFIQDRQLRADGIKVAVFRQVQAPDGRWVDAAVDGKTGADLENAILSRARQIRFASTQK